MMDLPASISDEQALDDLMTRPSAVLVDFMQAIQTPLVILGGGGKMGPTLAVLAKRAAEAAGRSLDVVSVSRFSNPEAGQWLETRGIRTLSLDLMERELYEQLPDTANIIYLIGLKFGTSQNPADTWATMTLPPALTCERYPQARMVALSSGNVYPLSSTAAGGSREDDALVPVGEYANACVARERIFEYFSRKNDTPLVLIRLFYALDLRYGVLLDLAQKIDRGEPVDLATGYVNCIWQGDANEMILRSLGLAQSPAAALNLTGTERLSVRETANQLGELLGKEVVFKGKETGSALLADTGRMVSALGLPASPINSVLRWTAQWVQRGGRQLNKPTHFETRDGRY